MSIFDVSYDTSIPSWVCVNKGLTDTLLLSYFKPGNFFLLWIFSFVVCMRFLRDVKTVFLIFLPGTQGVSQVVKVFLCHSRHVGREKVTVTSFH